MKIPADEGLLASLKTWPEGEGKGEGEGQGQGQTTPKHDQWRSSTVGHDDPNDDPDDDDLLQILG